MGNLTNQQETWQPFNKNRREMSENEERGIPGSAYCHRFGEEARFIDITLEAGCGEIGE